MFPLQVIDQCGRDIVLETIPQRIVSLVPSQTELLYDLGLDERVVGITRFCVRPSSWQKTKTIVGGTKNVDIRKVQDLKPDLIIANREENEKDSVYALAKQYSVWISDIVTLENALTLIREVARITNASTEGERILREIHGQLRRFNPLPAERVVYLIWNNPFMAAGRQTFIDAMITQIGWQNIVDEPRYPLVDIAWLRAQNPDRLLLSSEPFPFKQKHVTELQAYFPRVELVDGESFSWYGSRLINSFTYFSTLSHTNPADATSSQNNG